MPRLLPFAVAVLAASLAGCAAPPTRDPAVPAMPGRHAGATASPPAVEVPAIHRPGGETPAWWYRSGAAQAAANGAMDGRAKNVIVFLGDGMSLATVAAARILEGQRAGAPGEEHRLAWEHFPATAFSRTYNTDSQTPDSAGTMSAISTGVKTHMGAIGVSAGRRSDCAGALGSAVPGWLALADAAGLATGIVTTARITHATPAATYAHVPDRNWESDADLPAAAAAAGCRDIAAQLVEVAEGGRGPTVVLGGGRTNFLPEGVRDPEYPDVAGRRRDGRDLAAEWIARHPGGVLAVDSAQLEAARGAPAVLGLFEPSHMRYEADRADDPAGEPDIEAMTRFAIEALSREGRGYVLLVEGGRIDHANHDGNAFHALDETTAMSRAVRAAVEMTSADDTLVVVTADHSHVLHFAGYPARGNPILGLVARDGQPVRAADGLPYTTLGYANGPGAVSLPRPDPGRVDTTAPGFRQQALVPLASETHGGEDVGIWARGPGSAAFRGSMEQHAIHHVIVQATPRLRETACALGACDANGVPVSIIAPAALRAVAR
jgi:alkaline phosphatase